MNISEIEEPTFEEVLLYLNRLLNKETYIKVSGAIFKQMDDIQESYIREHSL